MHVKFNYINGITLQEKSNEFSEDTVISRGQRILSIQSDVPSDLVSFKKDAKQEPADTKNKIKMKQYIREILIYQLQTEEIYEKLDILEMKKNSDSPTYSSISKRSSTMGRDLKQTK